MTEPGQTVALVGHTGSGKTPTIVGLLQKFYLPTHGRILAFSDDNDLMEVTSHLSTPKMGSVQQNKLSLPGCR
ncbi:MAG: ATP-binding cassette domain-containing protein [Verrucomicrobiota bacterium]